MCLTETEEFTEEFRHGSLIEFIVIRGRPTAFGGHDARAFSGRSMIQNEMFCMAWSIRESELFCRSMNPSGELEAASCALCLGQKHVISRDVTCNASDRIEY